MIVKICEKCGDVGMNISIFGVTDIHTHTLYILYIPICGRGRDDGMKQ
jgi:hypothetical protein